MENMIKEFIKKYPEFKEECSEVELTDGWFDVLFIENVEEILDKHFVRKEIPQKLYHLMPRDWLIKYEVKKAIDEEIIVLTKINSPIFTITGLNLIKNRLNICKKELGIE